MYNVEVKKLKLPDGNEIPILGFGTWKLTGQTCVNAVTQALSVGFRHIDTADMYGNHNEVGRGIKESWVDRSEIFLTTKIPANDLLPDNVLSDGNRYLKELGVDYIDLLLIHWPNRKFEIAETLKAMMQLVKGEKVKSIGVSNFTEHHMEDIKAAGLKFSVNQVELHPTFNQFDLQKYCNENGIVLTAYSPLGKGDDINNHTIIEAAKKHNTTPSQVILSWIMSRGIVAIPKSATLSRIEDNFKSLELKLDSEDIEKINQIPQGNRMVEAGWSDFNY